MLTDEEKLVENHFVETYYREASGTYVVKIPIHPECKGLGESRNLAFRQFMQLEKRLEKKPELREKYVQYMREYISAGFMKPARETYDPKFAYWLPHHPVEKKFRVVVNASAKTSSGESLNCIQMTGGKLQHDLAIQIMRFGKYRNRQRMQTARRQCEGAQAIDFARQKLLYNKYNDWDKILNITAYVQRIFRIGRKENIYEGRYVLCNERKMAMEFWIRIEQEKHFKKEITCIKTGDVMPGKSKIASLRPMLDASGMLRVGGRIDKANIGYANRHQYIIPARSRLSFLLLK